MNGFVEIVMVAMMVERKEIISLVSEHFGFDKLAATMFCNKTPFLIEESKSYLVEESNNKFGDKFIVNFK